MQQLNGAVLFLNAFWSALLASLEQPSYLCLPQLSTPWQTERVIVYVPFKGKRGPHPSPDAPVLLSLTLHHLSAAGWHL